MAHGGWEARGCDIISYRHKERRAVVRVSRNSEGDPTDCVLAAGQRVSNVIVFPEMGAVKGTGCSCLNCTRRSRDSCRASSQGRNDASGLGSHDRRSEDGVFYLFILEV